MVVKDILKVWSKQLVCSAKSLYWTVTFPIRHWVVEPAPSYQLQANQLQANQLQANQLQANQLQATCLNI